MRVGTINKKLNCGGLSISLAMNIVIDRERARRRDKELHRRHRLSKTEFRRKLIADLH